MPFIRCHTVTIHYRWTDTGKERTFLFVNSLGTDFRIWEAVAERLAGHGNSLLFDKRGHGLSDTASEACAMDAYAADALCLLDAHQVERCVLVGVSIGGMIGQLIAARHGGRLERLVLSNTAPRIGTATAWNERIGLIQEYGIGHLSEAILARWFSEPFRNTHAAELAGYQNMLERTSRLGYVRACEAIRDADLSNEITAIETPTLCLAGSADLSTPPDLVCAMADRIPGASFSLIEGAGHLPCIETPDIVAHRILDFLDT
jgi:3-oxoadipate enol-lactonase